MDGTQSPRSGARSLARRAMTQQIAALALELFEERGYDATTIDDLCAATGISRTTFFRYFRTKEDVLMRDFEGLDETILEALVARPDSETPWRALCAAMQPLATTYAGDDVRTRRALALVIATPTLGGIHQAKLAAWVQRLRPELARRLGVDPDDPTEPRPVALITAAFGCLDAALAAWVAADGTKDLAALLEQANGVVG